MKIRIGEYKRIKQELTELDNTNRIAYIYRALQLEDKYYTYIAIHKKALRNYKEYKGGCKI